jgi:septum formation protein
MTPQFILASSSPRRLALLTQIGRPPDMVEAADLDETPLKGELPRGHTDRLALEKAQAIAAKYPEAVILAADTVVACGRRILPKAETEHQARDCLALLSGRRHRVHGGIAVIARGKAWVRHVETVVSFKRLTPQDIEAYIRSDEWRGKAGGYAIQGFAAAYVASINGSYPNIVGLCVYTAENLLAAAFQGA